jgi:hypothetical protein
MLPLVFGVVVDNVGSDCSTPDDFVAVVTDTLGMTDVVVMLASVFDTPVLVTEPKLGNADEGAGDTLLAGLEWVPVIVWSLVTVTGGLQSARLWTFR